MANYNSYPEDHFTLISSEGYAATRGEHIQEQTSDWTMGPVDTAQQAYFYSQPTGSWPSQDVQVIPQPVYRQVVQSFPLQPRRMFPEEGVSHFTDPLPVAQQPMLAYQGTEQGSSSPVASQWPAPSFPDAPHSAPSPQSSPSSPHSIPSPAASADSIKDSVKVEPEDTGCFIMEGPPQPSQSALVPPMEVPLRATQAPDEMRHMMNAFRINPFTMHSGEGRGVAQPSFQEAGPLESEPIILEFQLDVPTSESPKEESGSFTFAEGTARPDWDDDRDDDRSDPGFATQPVSWGSTDFSADGDPFSHSQAVVTDFTPRNASLLTSEPHYYSGRSVYSETNYNISGLTASPLPSPSTLNLNNQLRSSPQIAIGSGSTSWNRGSGGPLISTTSRSHSLDSPGTNDLQATMPTQGRVKLPKRWSMPQESTETGTRFVL